MLMCDTFFMPAAEASFFGKNSDRNPAEAQVIRAIPKREPSASISVGSRRFELDDKGYGLVLSCPAWMQGAEMGVNERGVAIGNEAVFSRFKRPADGVLGMDFLRAALAHADSAESARDALIALTERYDQGGNGAYKGKLVYDNSYLIAGPDGAYVLETAGKRWAWRQLDGPAAISNAYSLEADYKRLDPATRKAIAPVNERMACLDEADAGRLADKESWKAYVADRFMARMTAGESRRRAIESVLAAAAESGGGRQAAFAVLRAHAAPDPADPSRARNVCCHDRDNWGNATTGSMLLERRAGGAAVAWFTGASYPCLNLFKPALIDGGIVQLWEGYPLGDDARAAGYWERRRKAAGQAAKKPALAAAIASELAARQAELGAAVDALLAAGGAANTGAVDRARAEVSRIVSAWESR